MVESEDRAPDSDGEADPQSAKAKRGDSALLRFVATLLLPLAYLVGQQIPLPGVDHAQLEQLGGPDGFFLRGANLLSLGIAPLLTASVIVEAAAWAKPSWNLLRHRGEAGRDRLWRAVVLATLVLAVGQAYALSSALMTSPLVNTPGMRVHLLIIGSSVAGVFVSIFIAQLISKHGLGNGFVVLLGAEVLVDLGRTVASYLSAPETLSAATEVGVDPPATSTVKLALVLGLIVLMMLACWLGARPVPNTDDDTAKTSKEQTAVRSPYRVDGQTRELLGALPAPTSGVIPLVMASSLLSLPGYAAMFGSNSAFELQAWLNRGGVAFSVVHLTTVLLLTVLLSFAFNHPRRVLPLWQRVSNSNDTEKIRQTLSSSLTTAILRSLALLFVLWAALTVAALPGAVFSAVGLALLTALLIDMVAEHRARRQLPELVAIWPEHRPYAVELACRVLAAQGIRIHARNRLQRQMLQGFGPYVPIELMVPQGQAEQARALLSELFAPDQARNADDEAEPREELERLPLAAPGIAREMRPSRGLLLVGLAMLLLWIGGRSLLTSTREAHDATIKPAKLEVFCPSGSGARDGAGRDEWHRRSAAAFSARLSRGQHRFGSDQPACAHRRGGLQRSHSRRRAQRHHSDRAQAHGGYLRASRQPRLLGATRNTKTAG